MNLQEEEVAKKKKKSEKIDNGCRSKGGREMVGDR